MIRLSQTNSGKGPGSRLQYHVKSCKVVYYKKLACLSSYIQVSFCTRTSLTHRSLFVHGIFFVCSPMIRPSESSSRMRYHKKSAKMQVTHKVSMSVFVYVNLCCNTESQHVCVCRCSTRKRPNVCVCMHGSLFVYIHVFSRMIARSIFPSFFLGWRRPSLITGLGGWSTPD